MAEEGQLPTSTADEAQTEGATSTSESPPLPFNWNVSGVWVNIKERSDGLENFLKELGVGYVARKVVAGLSVVTTIEHTPGRYLLTDKSKLGESVNDFPTDGIRRMVKNDDGKRAWVSVRCDSSTGGKVRLDTESVDGNEKPTGITTVEHRWLESREVLCQTVEVFNKGVSKYLLRRFFQRQETEEERSLAEKRWSALVANPGPALPDPMNLAAAQERKDKAKQQQQQKPQPAPQPEVKRTQVPPSQPQPAAGAEPEAQTQEGAVPPRGSLFSSAYNGPWPATPGPAKTAAPPVATLFALGLVVLLVQMPQVALIVGGGALAYAFANPETLVRLIGEKEFRREQERRHKREWLGKAADAMHRAALSRPPQEGKAS